MKQWFQNISKTDIRNMLAILWTLGAFSVLMLLIARPIPAENKEVIYTSVGTLLTSTGLVLSFFFSASKTDGKKPDA